MNRRRFLAACAAGLACAAVPFRPAAARAAALATQRGRLGTAPSPYFAAEAGGAVRCTLCPRVCVIAPGSRGHCEVRENRGGTLTSLVYANPCVLHVDPVEKKPFFHVLPGTRALSLATAGCNLDCAFCQNWEISQARPEDTDNFDLPPAAAVALAREHGCASLASTYVEPTIFMEYMQALGRECRAAGVLSVMHSNGYVQEKPLDDLCAVLDAACIDLKGFSDVYYREVTGGRLAPVLASLARLRARGVHLELVTLLVPGRNDDPEEIAALAAWVRDTLGPDTPLHLTRFYPAYRLTALAPTPVPTMERALSAARAAGLSFVYLGNVPGHPAESTTCPHCGRELIRRVGFTSEITGLKSGRCAGCGRPIPGIWG